MKRNEYDKNNAEQKYNTDGYDYTADGIDYTASQPTQVEINAQINAELWREMARAENNRQRARESVRSSKQYSARRYDKDYYPFKDYRDHKRASWDREVAKARIIAYRKEQKAARDTYLQEANAVATPMELYALFVAVLEQQGQRIVTVGRRYRLAENVTRHTPSKSVIIPALDMEHKLNLFIYEAISGEQTLAAEKGSEADANGSWGNAVAVILKLDGTVWASQKISQFATYIDVEAYRAGKTMEQLIHGAKKAVAETHLNPRRVTSDLPKKDNEEVWF